MTNANEKKIRDIKSEVIGYDGNTITLKLHDEIDIKKVQRLTENNRFLTLLNFYDKNSITVDQRAHFYALVGDIYEYTGVPKDIIEADLKYMFMHHYYLDEMPSLADGAMERSTATELITFVIELCVREGIPFRKQQFYLTADVSRILYAYTMKRLCWVCGKEHSSLHHAVNLVGMGGDRTKFNHLQSKFMVLCEGGTDVEDENKIASHHGEAHKIGLKAFCEKYHFYPIKLNAKDLKELNVQGNLEE